MSRTKAMFCTFLVTIFTMSLVGIIAQIPVVAILDIVCGAAIGCVAVFGIAIIFNVLYEKEK